MKAALSFLISGLLALSGAHAADHEAWKELSALDAPGGYPTAEASARLYDELDFQRAVQVYLWALPAMNIDAMRQGSEATFGAGNHILPVWKDRLNTRTRVTTPNSDVVYAMSYLDLKNGPVVVEVPPKLQGMFCTFWHRPLCDVGFVGPDKGEGGKYLLLPPDYEGEAPEGFFTFKSETYRVFLFWRGFLVDGKTDNAVQTIEQTRVYPLGKKDSATRMTFPNASEKPSNMLVTQDISYFENLKKFIDYEPAHREDFAMRGMMATLGIIKGEPFEPDARMQAILNRAANVAWKIASAQRYERRMEGTLRYPDRQYDEGFIGGSEVFEGKSFLNLDARTAFFRFAYSSSPGMVVDMVGKGSKYPLTFKDADGNFLMGQNHYKLHLPAGIPAENFWAVTLYDAPTAAGVNKPGQLIPSLSSQGELKYNEDGSIDLYFGPDKPESAPESNYIGTNPAEGFFVVIRLYSPGKAYFDKSWKPDDVVKID
ncbi:DUF1254 domain-containing protein [Sulfuriroseicoccus oceanibius]|uniref:DUF1254 domain-containing protein n=1 Tax=Sulfuriroseicoccus oceanibius TaxID=2707525 RepID=A0A6B3L1A5_9BACT|nr:DUF1254 domain-containing protein [Sulfuriroseicoccus oceanibius]QQL46087.1 DUF1254 domain-containing protein [Sulfuriroseicoccus oceanibius]